MASQWSTGRTPPGMRQASASRQRASNAPAHRGSPSPHWYPESNGQTFGERTDYPARSVSRNGSTPDRSTAYPRHQPPHHSRAYGQDTYGRDPYSHIHMPDPHARRYSRDVFGRQAAPTPPSRGYGYGETHRPRSYGYDEVPRSRGHGYDEAARTRSYFADSYGHEARTRDPYGQESRVRDPFRGSSGQEHHSCESKWDDESRAGAVPRPHSRVHEVQSEAWSHSRTNHRDADLALPDQSPPLNRHLSNKSMSVSSDLDTIEKELARLTALSKEADRVLSDPSADVPVGLRNELSQLHGNANSLLATRLDAILTGELNSGREVARARRKEMIRAAEALIEHVEQQVRKIDERAGR